MVIDSYLQSVQGKAEGQCDQIFKFEGKIYSSSCMIVGLGEWGLVKVI